MIIGLIGNPIIPFNTIHQGPFSFSNQDRRCFLPGCHVKVKILRYERDGRSRSKLLNPNVYYIQISHGDQTWTISRRYKHFLYLHEQMILYNARLHIPMPSKDHRERRRSVIQNKESVPRLPKKPEALVKTEELDTRMVQLETYLQQLIRNPTFRNHPETLKFLEVSHFSFVNNLGQKSQEGVIKKRAGGRRIAGCCKCFGKVRSLGHWSQRWLVVKDTFVMYLRPEDGRIGDVILMDKDFRVKSGQTETGEQDGLQISNLSRHLYLRCWTARKAKEWMSNISTFSSTLGKQFTDPNRFDSFAPIRVDTQANWFIDGAGYFNAVASALENAKEEIYITDWWLSPEIYMKRPVNEGDYWRLDVILKRKAEQGVRIFILLWKEIELAIGINSYYSKQTLASRHSNIKVLRHPDHAPGGVLYWAHHEKLVIIDQRTAFAGGIDLCFGRWDTPNHFLSDIGSVDPEQVSLNLNQNGNDFPSTTTVSTNLTTPGATPSATPRDRSLSVPQRTLIENSGENVNVRRISQPLDGPSPERARQNIFLSRQNAVDEVDQTSEKPAPTFNKQTTPQLRRKIDAILKAKNKFKQTLQKRRESAARRDSDLDSDDGGKVAEMRVAYIARDLSVKRYEFMGNSKLWIGKDYTNFIYRDFVDLDLPFDDFIDRSNIPRMPWHDIGLVVYGRAAQDLARHFIQRWNFTKLEKVKENLNFPMLLPKSYEKVPVPRSVLEGTIRCNCQVLRSASDWSAGIKYAEHSIQNAYIHCIENAQHYIYIENQFFISIADHAEVTNGIADALFRRIYKAHANGETFRVFVILPLLPAFEGEIGTSRGVSIQAITHWNYSSICRGGKSLIERLQHEGVNDYLQYISFFGLRTFAELGNDWVTELVYVHSKLMIVDDTTVICGSANINDRSMLGKRDSEIAIICQDTITFPSKMNGKPYRAGQYAATLRKSLMAEHLGVTELSRGPDLSDPISDEFYKNIWITQAAQNTSIFEKVFRCIPSNEVQSFQELSAYQKVLPLSEEDPDTAKELLDKVQGHLVLFPTFFLCREDLQPPVGTKESLVPVSTWT
ncbi:phospholipase D1-like [Tubulanus polymorphus]|uniref:phospholipase D1-like n=1 Tax=Tubulanus polymorphus TaxID=672921 RepID=UPI003DA57843